MRAVSFNDLVGAERKCRRNVQSEHPSGLEIDDQLVLGRRLNREFAWLLASQNAIDVGRRPSPLIDLIGPVGHQSALGYVISKRIDCRQAMPRRRYDDQSTVRNETGM